MNLIRYGLLFLPYVLAVLLQESPTLSYAVAWSGSFWIFYLTLWGHVKPLPGGSSLEQQLLRPVGFTQLILMGYTAVTSIFYFLSLNGCFYFECTALQMAPLQERELTASAQRYYVLAHAAFATGVLLPMDYRKSREWTIRWNGETAWLALYAAGGLLLGIQVLKFLPGLGQVQVYFSNVAMVASVLALALALMRKTSSWLLPVAGTVYVWNIFEALLSGWKSAVLAPTILLFLFLYPKYKQTVATLGPVVLAVLIFILPTYVSTFRALNWSGSAQDEVAAEMAFERVREARSEEIKKNTWNFLTLRLSEVSQFSNYIREASKRNSYYGLSLVENGFIAIVPGAVWSGKPSMEELTMERVYEHGIVKRGVQVSAKPKFIVDAYLSGRGVGVLVGFLLFGILTTLASRMCERYFGGYLMGGVVYLGVFRVFWLSNSFEFFFNNVFWGFLIAGVLFVGGRMAGYIVRRPQKRKVEA
jgi:hypothetical protein